MEELFNPDGLVLSADYADTMARIVMPYLDEHRTDEIVAGFEDKPLFTSRFQADGEARGTVFILHGFTENAVKYSEIIYSLLQNGFCVLAYDQRGHGRSWKDERRGDESLVHVADFVKYEKDLDCVRRAMEGKLPKPWKVFCHSMGGAVTALFLINHKGVFERAAMCAPMIAVNRRKMPFFGSKLMARGFKLAGKGRQRMFVSHPYSQRESFEGACATGRERFDWYSDIKHANPLFHDNGPSYSWMLEALRVSQWLLFPGAPLRIDCPVKIYSADDDWEVLASAQRMFTRRLRHGQIQTVPGSRHEIYRSADETLFPWWSDVLAFLKAEQTS
ncbi:MAG: alpha/beta hydrolase [Clostridia bacterium]|nr:alpha/beta hydrolase [Clostridia bacterium]